MRFGIIAKMVLLTIVAVLIIGASGCGADESSQDSQPIQTGEPEERMTGEELMKELKIGLNWGNTFDAPAGETSWGNPFTTREMLEKVKELGFNTIRIPISWGKHVSAGPDYMIDEAWMNRIGTVVDQALDAGLYVIINSHHDNEIYMPTPDNAQTGKAYLNAIWTQIGEYFKEYDHRLIFQTMNEPRVVGTFYEWSVDTQNEDCMAAIDVVNELNQSALSAIRTTGGKNADRFVIVSPYAATPMAVLNSRFHMPEDTVEDRLILSIHAYTPYNLCLNIYSPEDEFNLSHLSEIRSFMKNVNYRYVQKGIPVIIDEMGCVNKNNPEARYAWAKAYVSAAAEYGMPCIWWDNGEISGSGENFGLLNRRKLEVFEQSQRAYEGLMEGLKTQE